MKGTKRHQYLDTTYNEQHKFKAENSRILSPDINRFTNKNIVSELIQVLPTLNSPLGSILSHKARSILSPLRVKRETKINEVLLKSKDDIQNCNQISNSSPSGIDENEVKFKKLIDKYVYTLVFKRMRKRVNASRRGRLTGLKFCKRAVENVRSLSPQSATIDNKCALNSENINLNQLESKISKSSFPLDYEEEHQKQLERIFSLGKIFFSMN